METLDQGAVEAVAKLAKASSSQVVNITAPSDMKGVPSSIPVLFNPETGQVHGLADQFEKYRTKPTRKTGVAKAETLESFIALTNLHKQENSVIFADTSWKNPILLAVVDYHSASAPDNGKHRIAYRFPVSEEWAAWLAIDNKPMTQEAFAEFIEDHIADLSTPDLQEQEDFGSMFAAKVGFPNEIIGLSRGLQIHAETRVKQAIKLQTGESQITFEEDHKTANGDPLNVPGVFILNIAPFFMGESARVPVRLRYRLRDGKLSWSCQLYRPDKYITEQVRADMDQASEETELPAFEGNPEMAA